jgi:hypothetical protein
MLTPLEEYEAALREIEDLVGKLGLLIVGFRRLGEHLGLKQHPDEEECGNG